MSLDLYIEPAALQALTIVLGIIGLVLLWPKIAPRKPSTPTTATTTAKGELSL